MFKMEVDNPEHQDTDQPTMQMIHSSQDSSEQQDINLTSSQAVDCFEDVGKTYQ